MACLATSLNAIFCAVRLGAAAIHNIFSTASGKSMDHCIACIPPKLPPTIAYSFSIPKLLINFF